MVIKRDIRTLPLAELETFFLSSGQKKFRAAQVYEWLWKKSCRSFCEMTNLSKEIRALLEQQYSFLAVTAGIEQRSTDGTIKNTFLLHDGLKVEGVLIPSDGRTTACISSQAGCPLACRFCATGHLGFRRNLHFTEIYDQVSLLHEQSLKNYGKPLSNIVYMGMGEPLLNYENVRLSIERITDPDGMGMSPQRITVSSVGIPDKIVSMAHDDPRYHFALSLHAAKDEKRDRIIPVNKKYPLKELIRALKKYHEVTKKRITIEYILFQGFNDSLGDAADLAAFCRNFPVKINLIEYNAVADTGFYTSGADALKSFRGYLEQKNLVVNVRKSRGSDIDAACGQLAGK